MDAAATPFDNRFTRAFGWPIERIQTKVRPQLTEPIKAFIAASPLVVMATSDREGRCDASPKGGLPGFVRVLDDGHLLVPDVEGNKLFQSYLNMDENPHVGLLFLIPGLSEVVRVNGRVRIVSKGELDRRGVDGARHDPDVTRDVIQGILVEVEEAYTHCPRALNYSRLWDTDAILARQASGEHPLRPRVTV
ncbi:MAG TPA: pyridoxamine 5'-phosphate oxidase family protein [Chloroflexota bacterium]|nr:pyridoxamine 5'-phosphate oxidase family protein [Chloroflexota bacterium]